MYKIISKIQFSLVSDICTIGFLTRGRRGALIYVEGTATTFHSL